MTELAVLSAHHVVVEARNNHFVQGLSGRSTMHVIWSRNSNLRVPEDSFETGNQIGGNSSLLSSQTSKFQKFELLKMNSAQDRLKPEDVLCWPASWRMVCDLGSHLTQDWVFKSEPDPGQISSSR